nr:putative integron gene cassette protein [uncultured bacterium]
MLGHRQVLAESTLADGRSGLNGCKALTQNLTFVVRAHLGSGQAVLSQIAPSRNSLDLAWSAQAQARYKRHRKSHFSSQRTEPKQVPENLWERLAHVVCRQFARIFFLGPNARVQRQG